MGQLRFETKMSGVRVNLPEDLKIETTMAWIPYYDTPEWVQKDLWWMVLGMDLEILPEKGKPTFKIRPKKYIGDAVGEISNCRIDEKILEMCVGSIGHDDQVKIWIFNNRKDLWNELLERFKTVENIWNMYLRFNH